MTTPESPYQLPANAIAALQSHQFFETRDLMLVYRLTECFATGQSVLVECGGKLYQAIAVNEERHCRFTVSVSPYTPPPGTESTP
jgi:hypothetical protein